MKVAAAIIANSNDVLRGSGIRQVQGEGQIEVSHILIALIGSGGHLEQLGDILYFIVKLRPVRSGFASIAHPVSD